MKAKSIRRLDGQGRVILPAHIRKALNLAQDSAVTIDMTEDGEIRIRPEKERCCICGREAREDALQLDSGKLVCHRCVNIIREETKNGKNQNRRSAAGRRNNHRTPGELLRSGRRTGRGCV